MAFRWRFPSAFRICFLYVSLVASQTSNSSDSQSEDGPASDKPEYCNYNEKPLDAPKLCRPCAPLDFIGIDRCKYNLTDCQNVEPGGSCQITCAAPYQGTPTTATCMVGNSNPVKKLDWTLPECICPDPVGDQTAFGYKRSYRGGWECADGFAPVDANSPQKRCGCNEEHRLVGCAPLVPCAPPELDECSYDITGCESVQPGQKCTIRCRTENGMSPGQTVASCNSTNTNPLRQLYWFPLRCTLADCPDDVEEEGYNFSDDGGWQCAAGYSGKVVKECEKGSAWSSRRRERRRRGTAIPLEAFTTKDMDMDNMLNHTEFGRSTTAFHKADKDQNGMIDPDEFQKSTECQGTTVLTGCKKIVNCLQPSLTIDDTVNPPIFDGCEFDLSSCQSVAPNATCEVHCKEPYKGLSTLAYCPASNVDPDGLLWDRPVCRIEECGEPREIGSGYVKLGTDSQTSYKCAASYTGFPKKVCMPTRSCEPLATLGGCIQLVPCGQPEGNSCVFQTSDCQSVPPGETCTIRCKAPFVGNASTGICTPSNSDPNGLVWTEPECATSTSCPDPNALPAGYARANDGIGLVCAPGYAGTVEKICYWIEETCTAQSELKGCFPLLPCLPYNVGGRDSCMQNVSSACSAVMPGHQCVVGCASGYTGTAGIMTCPHGNVDANRSLEGTGPTCECPPPTGRTPGFNWTIGSAREASWLTCSQGYLGEVQKECNPQPPTCEVITTPKGCDAPVPCDVSDFVDEDARPGFISGKVTFGPAQVGPDIDEQWVLDYQLFFADECDYVLGERIGDPIRVPQMPSALDPPPTAQACETIRGKWAHENDSDITTITQIGCQFSFSHKVRPWTGDGIVEVDAVNLWGMVGTIKKLPESVTIEWSDGHVWYREGLVKDPMICCRADVYEIEIPSGTRIPENAQHMLVFATIPNGEYGTGVDFGPGGGRAAVGRKVNIDDAGTRPVVTGGACRSTTVPHIIQLFPLCLAIARAIGAKSTR